MTTITIEEAREIADDAGYMVAKWLKKKGITDAPGWDKIIGDIIANSLEGYIAGKEEAQENEWRMRNDEEE